MQTEIIIAILSLIGTFIGTFGGIVVSNKLTNYRIEQLEKKVEKHNSLVERQYQTEKNVAVLQEDVENLKTRVV